MVVIVVAVVVQAASALPGLVVAVSVAVSCPVSVAGVIPWWSRGPSGLAVVARVLFGVIAAVILRVMVWALLGIIWIALPVIFLLGIIAILGIVFLVGIILVVGILAAAAVCRVAALFSFRKVYVTALAAAVVSILIVFLSVVHCMDGLCGE